MGDNRHKAGIWNHQDRLRDDPEYRAHFEEHRAQEDHKMTAEQRELESATWNVAVVDAEVKLYLLALVRTMDPSAAQRLSGLDDAAARSARGWLREVGVLREDGSVDGERLLHARDQRLTVLVA